MPESSTFRTSFPSQRVNGSQILLKPERQSFRPNFPLISDELNWKTSVIVKYQILEMFFNTSTVFHIFFRQIWEKFPQHFQTQLSSKSKKFSHIFIVIVKST